MNNMFKFLIVSILSFSVLIAKDYSVDTSHSLVEFKLKHLSISNVKGTFSKFSGYLSVDNNKLTALNGEVEIDSINTNNENRDAHIKDPDYFDAKKFPKATLKLTNASSGEFEITIKGITKKVKLEVEVFGVSKNQAGKEVIGLNLSGKINRKDFDIAKGTPNAALGEEISISIDIEGMAK
ncbi:MAG: YceI family protein [Helicobacteraceae bacterium]|nr:YceI family protein [Helicobacteraceae bacterium]